MGSSLGRLAGIDYGSKRIGIAVTDPGRTMASPYENYTRVSKEKDAAHFRRLVKEERIVAIVVGLPVHLSGDESQKSLEARHFGQWLGEVTGLSVKYFDERYTTVDAEQLLQSANLTKKQRKARLDKLAAQLMLTAYLESTRRDAPPLST